MHREPLGMVAVILAALVAPASPLPSVAELVFRHRRALGRIVSTTARWSGSVARGDSVEKFEVTADHAGRYRESWTSPVATRLEGSDGTVDWAEDVNGNVTTRPTDHSFSFEFALVRLNDFRIDDERQASVRAPVDVNGRQAYPLKVGDPPHGITLYVDADSGLLDGADAGGHVVRYQKYRIFDRTPIPTLVTDTADGMTLTRTIDNVTFSVPVAGVFDAPPSREPLFPSGTDEVVVNFDSPRGLIVLAAKINDRPVRLILDSGSSTSVLDSGLATQLKLATGGTAQVQGAGEISGTFARIDRLEVAGITFAPFVVESVPLKLPEALARERIDGVLGYDFLAHIVTRIAYYSRELRFRKPSAFSYSGTGAVLPLDASTRVPRVDAIVGDGDHATFTVDTGNDQGLVLYFQFANAHPRDFVDPVDVSPQSASGIGGEFSTRAGVVTFLSLGKFSVAHVPAQIVLRAVGAFAPGVSDGLIGARLLSQFRAVFLDYRGKRVILEQ